jgi:arylsulfatase A-like enzyme
LDQLAKSGIRFTNFFWASPVCSPARASIFAGMIPSTHGVHDWIKGENVETDSCLGVPVRILDNMSLICRDWQNQDIVVELRGNGI